MPTRRTGDPPIRWACSTPTSPSSSGWRPWEPVCGGSSRARRRPDTGTSRLTELYLLLEGTGRLRVDGELLTLAPLDAVFVEPESVRQPFNDTAPDQLWLVVGAPNEAANTLEMSAETLAKLYPDGPKAMPPELGS